MLKLNLSLFFKWLVKKAINSGEFFLLQYNTTHLFDCENMHS